jgi:hypothetical protein
LTVLAYFPRTASFNPPTAFCGKAEAIGNMKAA